MIKKIKKYVAMLAVVGLFAVPAMVPATAYAADEDVIQSGLCGGVELKFESGDCVEGQSTGRLNNLIKTIINVISIVVGVVAVIMIVFGGLRYITSGGDSSNVSSAKNTIIYAIIGLVIVALAQFIVRFVLEKSLDAGGAGL